jgi:hypothetical protein
MTIGSQGTLSKRHGAQLNGWLVFVAILEFKMAQEKEERGCKRLGCGPGK